MSYDALKNSHANLKHIIVFSDGDPSPPSQALMQQIVSDRITVSTVLISGHSPPDTMMFMANEGKGRFYNVTSPNELPQIFIKETAVILKSAIYEDPFKPQLRSQTELIRGISAADYPTLLGNVATSEKPRAETPLVTDKGDPLLAHWQYGLGRAVAFTSDAKPKWGKMWLNWDKYRQFWSQVGQWSLRRIDNADFNTEVSVDKGEGVINVEALDSQGNYKNFLDLQTVVVSPKGEHQTVRLEQTGPGHYEARFPTKDVGAYMLNLMEMKGTNVQAYQSVGASVNYSPEFTASEPNRSLLRRIAESSGGKILDVDDPSLNPFEHDRRKTFQPRDLWETLLKLAIILFVADVGVRRIQLEREEMAKAWRFIREKVFFWSPPPRPVEVEESLAALLARRDQVRSQQPVSTGQPSADLFRPAKPVTEPLPGFSDLSAAEPGAPAETPPAEPQKPQAKPEPSSTTSRLLEAKRRAQKRRPD
jgi:hypothetical protein